MSEQKENRKILCEIPEEIVGERIVLRPFRQEDGPAVYEAVEESRAHLLPWMPWVQPTYTLEDANAYVRRARAHWILREDLPIGLWRRSDERFLGGSGLHRIDWEVPRFEIGYWVRQSEEGKGYITEAVTLLCHLAYTTLGANRVEIRCDARNDRSAAVPRRLGFVHEATLRSNSRSTSGELRDDFIFGMTRPEYERLTIAK